MPKKDATKIGEILVLIGGIVGLIDGLLMILGMAALSAFLPGIGLGGILGGLITGIIVIVLALVVLATSGAVNIPALKLGKNWIIILILGILIYVFGAGLAGFLVIIGAILLAL